MTHLRAEKDAAQAETNAVKAEMNALKVEKEMDLLQLRVEKSEEVLVVTDNMHNTLLEKLGQVPSSQICVPGNLLFKYCQS